MTSAAENWENWARERAQDSVAAREFFGHRLSGSNSAGLRHFSYLRLSTRKNIPHISSKNTPLRALPVLRGCFGTPSPTTGGGR